MISVNLSAFKQRVHHRKTAFKRFLTKLEKDPPRGLDKLTGQIEKEVWLEVDCLTCANCCKTMSPTYTTKDIKRIAAHYEISPKAFTKKWLRKDKSGDWLNKSTPCQFLNMETNMCGIYGIRPADCAGFPHLPKKKMVEYMHVHKQNIELCPATYKMVEKMMMMMHSLS